MRKMLLQVKKMLKMTSKSPDVRSATPSRFSPKSLWTPGSQMYTSQLWDQKLLICQSLNLRYFYRNPSKLSASPSPAQQICFLYIQWIRNIALRGTQKVSSVDSSNQVLFNTYLLIFIFMMLGLYHCIMFQGQFKHLIKCKRTWKYTSSSKMQEHRVLLEQTIWSHLPEPRIMMWKLLSYRWGDKRTWKASSSHSLG